MRLKTAECVTPKHPDKICDNISDSILDYCLKHDQMSRVAIETVGGHGQVHVTGEITSNAEIPFNQIIEDVYGKKINVTTNVVKQSNYIAQGVDTGGAGDQGIMVGYACNENEELIPQELYLARQRCKKIYKTYPFDGKTQVTLKDGKIKTVVASFQNSKTTNLKSIIVKWLKTINIDPEDVELHCNPAGEWNVGGFDADAGLTGRKLVVDNYGPSIPIGGGAFSGKDPTKVDRSAAYMARRIAVDKINSINNNQKNEVYVYLAYAIGHDQPVQATIIANGIEEEVTGYDLSPKGIIEFLDLRKPKYSETAKWGHMGTNQQWG